MHARGESDVAASELTRGAVLNARAPVGGVDSTALGSAIEERFLQGAREVGALPVIERKLAAGER